MELDEIMMVQSHLTKVLLLNTEMFGFMKHLMEDFHLTAVWDVLKMTRLCNHRLSVCLTLMNLNKHMSVFAGHLNHIKYNGQKHSEWYGNLTTVDSDI